MSDRTRVWRPLSVRARTTAAATLVVAVALIAAGWVMIHHLESNLTRGVDEVLNRQLGVAATALQDGAPLPLVDRAVTIRIASPDGEPLSAPLPPFAPTADQPGEPRRIVFAAPVQPALREASTTVPVPGEGAVLITADADTQSIRDATRATTHLLLLAAPPLLLLVAALTWFATGRALRPVDSIRGEFARLTTQNLGRRMPVPATGDEIARLATTLNDTLARLEQSTRRERQFIADASHELRSPLANVRTPLEVAARYPDRAEWPTVATGALEDLDRLEALISDLLTLARLDTAPDLPLTPLDLGTLVHDVIDRRPATAITWTVEVADDVTVAGHRTHLARLITNLLDNAEAHAESQATVRLSATDGHAVLDIVDDGPGIAPADRDRVFERFARLDTARTRARGGTGLGLALARDIATLHHATLAVADSPKGAHLEARLPLLGALP
ncbi:HAMP domain-containing histidine kinase [Nocardia uniformis]|uniref:histidine kinase n=1 Tax=Nocardia uniformis TaxID=53432 RepID=A0A849BQE3_9NOCA|nr:HAMP domain-containing sensor histidine kinase [Nocardia uniformis]NNH68284.1 HAMP domain-containing histidine kinase [Nocardia uniformis]